MISGIISRPKGGAEIKMIYFLSDYSGGAHPKVLDAIVKTNAENSDGYGNDVHSENAANMIRRMVGSDSCAVHFMTGGTSCNVTFIASCLRPYESVIAPRTGHAYFHETGAVESTGHRVTAVDGINGKLTPLLIDKALAEHQDEHTPLPGLVYISQPTELGSVYTKAELCALRNKCLESGLLLYIDGARLGCALTSGGCDLTINDIAALCDAFYIGGTKNGALFGEALVIMNEALDDHFRYMIKQKCGLFAKGRLIGVQFEALLDKGDESLYFSCAKKANERARQLIAGLSRLGIEFEGASLTNQIFPILPANVVKELKKDFAFYEWAPEKDGMVTVRLVTSYNTTKKGRGRAFARRKAFFEKLREKKGL